MTVDILNQLRIYQFFSEASLIRYRIKIEIYYFIELCKVIPNLKKKKNKLREVEKNLSKRFRQGHIKSQKN